MSSMLEQAIIDAAALKDAAIQSAEQVVIQQYSEQIKETVDKLLEQAPPEGAEATSYGADAPEDEDLEMGIDDQLDDVAPNKNGGLMSALADLSGLGDEDEVEIELDNLMEDADDTFDKVFGSEVEDPDSESESDLTATSMLEEEEDNCELEESELEEMAESLTFEYDNVPGGGFANGQMQPAHAYEDMAEDINGLSHAISEYNDELEEENKELKEQNEKLSKQVVESIKTKKEFAVVLKEFKSKFNEVQLMNAKLHYTNLALVDDSLNERQKKKIVESINKVSSLEQAKIVYETLQSGVSGAESAPKSLSEVVSERNSSSLLLHAHRNRGNGQRIRGEQKENKNNDFADRMKALAGITKT